MLQKDPKWQIWPVLSRAPLHPQSCMAKTDERDRKGPQSSKSQPRLAAVPSSASAQSTETGTGVGGVLRTHSL